MDVPQKPRTERSHDPETLPLGPPTRTEVGMWRDTHSSVHCSNVEAASYDQWRDG